MPPRWNTDVFTNCTRNATSNKLKIPQKDFKKSGKYPIIDQSVDFIAGFTDNSEKLYKGDLPVIVFGDHTRIFKYVDFPFALGADGVQVLVPVKSKLIGKYLYFFLKALIIENHGYSRHYKFLKEKEITIPPKETQTRIVELLEKAEQLQQWRKESDKLTNDYLNSVFLKMFGDPQHNPLKWKVITINDAVEYSQYGTSSKSNAQKNGYPIIGMSNLTYEGTLDLSELSYVELTKSEFEKLKLHKGDVIFNRTNSSELVGKTTYWDRDIDAVLASYLVKIKMKNNVNPVFFVHLMNTEYFKRLFSTRCRKAVNQANISPTLLKKFAMYLPPIEVQNRFALTIEQIKLVNGRQKDSDYEISCLFNSLIQKAFKGELVA